MSFFKLLHWQPANAQISLHKFQSFMFIHAVSHEHSLLTHTLFGSSEKFRSKVDILPQLFIGITLRQCNKYYYMGPVARKTVFGGLQTTKVQTSLRICAVLSAPLLFPYCKVSYLGSLQAKFQIST